MTRSVHAQAGRFTRAIAKDLVEAVRREKAYYKGEPNSALLFLTYRCTSRCRTCKMWSRPWDQRKELSLEQWIKLADSLILGGVRAMELFGGDVLLRKDILFQLIKHLKAHKVTVHVPTNCNLLDDETARRLVESQVDCLYLSTDGVDDLHDVVRGVENTFQKVQRAAAMLIKYRNGREIPRLVCNTTVSKYNVESLSNIARFAANTGFDEIHFEYAGEMTPEDVASSVVDGLEPTPYFLRGETPILVSPPQARAVKNELSAIRSEYSSPTFDVVTLNMDCLSERHLVQGTVPKGKCYTERCEVTVDPGGNVVACPFFHSFTFGNLLEDSFKNIWWSEQHRRFHDYVRDTGLPMCRHCILCVQRNHSFAMRLKRISLTRMRTVREKLRYMVAGNGN